MHRSSAEIAAKPLRRMFCIRRRPRLRLWIVTGVGGTRLTRMFGYLMLASARWFLARSDGAKPLHRAVCDFIAGMTDRYFFRVYGQLFG